VPLSISASERRFFALILATFVALFAIANVVAFWDMERRSERPIAFPIGRFNEIVLERFAVDPSRWEIVGVGSSASADIPPYGYWPRNFYSLAQLGSSANTGIEALLRSPARPRLVLIESDYMFRPPDQKLLDRLYSPSAQWLKRVFPALREEYAPLAFLRWNFQRFDFWPIQDGFGTWEQHKDGLAKRAKNHLGEIMKDDAIREAVATNRKRVDRLRESGAEVVFFELPLYPTLADGPFFKRWRTAMRQTFADYRWVSFAPQDYLTTDGVHCYPREGLRIFKRLVEQKAEGV
jgi:hypothetical protein